MISNGQKVAFIEVELLTFLKMNTPGGPKQFKDGYKKAISLLESYKQYLINKESDEQEYQPIGGHQDMD